MTGMQGSNAAKGKGEVGFQPTSSQSPRNSVHEHPSESTTAPEHAISTPRSINDVYAVAAQLVQRELPASFRRTNYSGYYLADRDVVLEALKEQGVESEYERVIFEHATHTYPSKDRAPEVQRVEIIGSVCEDGVQAVVVSIDGSHERADGSYYHITLSLGEGHKPVESNALLQRLGFTPLQRNIPVDVIPF